MNLDNSGKRQVCAVLMEAKNLAKMEPLESGLAGATSTKNAFAQQLKRDGKSTLTIRNCVNILDLMERKGVNVLNPEEVKAFVSEQKWTNHSKATVV